MFEAAMKALLFRLPESVRLAFFFFNREPRAHLGLLGWAKECSARSRLEPCGGQRWPEREGRARPPRWDPGDGPKAPGRSGRAGVGAGVEGGRSAVPLQPRQGSDRSRAGPGGAGRAHLAEARPRRRAGPGGVRAPRRWPTRLRHSARAAGMRGAGCLWPRAGFPRSRPPGGAGPSRPRDL